MSLKDQITEDMKTAMRAKDSERLGTIRLLLAALKQKEVDERVELRLRRLDRDTTLVFANGSQPVFAANSRWLAYTVTPTPAPRRRAAVAVPAEPAVEVGEDRLAAAQVLGERVSRFLAARNHGEGGDRAEAAAAAGLYGELVAALRTWSITYGPPAEDAELAHHKSASMLAFHAAFQADGSLGPAFSQAPVYVAAYQGSAEDVGAQAEHLYQRGGAFTLVGLQALHRVVHLAAGVQAAFEVVVVKLHRKGLQVQVLLVAQVGHGELADAVEVVHIAAGGELAVV